MLGGVGLLGGSRYLRRLHQTKTLIPERIQPGPGCAERWHWAGVYVRGLLLAASEC